MQIVIEEEIGFVPDSVRYIFEDGSVVEAKSGSGSYFPAPARNKDLKSRQGD